MNLQCHLRLISPTYKEYKLPIRWELGSLNKQNKNVEQNCIFERAGRGTIVQVTISMSIKIVENYTKIYFTGN